MTAREALIGTVLMLEVGATGFGSTLTVIDRTGRITAKAVLTGRDEALLVVALARTAKSGNLCPSVADGPS